MRLLLADGVPPELRGALEAVSARLAAPDLVRAAPDVLAVVGTPDPLELARAEGPLVAVPLAAEHAPSAVRSRADAVAVLDPGDLPPGPAPAPVVVLGVPAPPPSAAAEPLDPGPGTHGLADALRAEEGEDAPARVAHGVTWIRGAGAVQTARAAAAWRAGRAVLALPGTPSTPLLERAGCPRCPTALATIELTRLLLHAPALGRMLAERGRATVGGLPSVEEVALGLLEAAELARVTRAGAGPEGDAASLPGR